MTVLAGFSEWPNRSWLATGSVGHRVGLLAQTEPGGQLGWRVAAMVALAGLAVVVATVLQRRRPDPPSAPSYRAPSQIDRDDFDHRNLPVLVVVFASTTCDTCPGVWDVVSRHGSDIVGVQRVDVQTSPELHERYRIDGVPTTLMVNPDGVVVQAYFGPLVENELAPALEVLVASVGDE